MIAYAYDDGGRAEAGFRGDADDCAVRAIAIATGLPYREVYDGLYDGERHDALTRGKGRQPRSPRNGVRRKVHDPWLAARGWEWTPTMFVGQGCTVHLRADELPGGPVIVRLSKHLAAVVDGTLRDTFDCSRNGTRCVYGYWTPGKDTP